MAGGGGGGDSSEPRQRRGHVLLLPYPSQGHINPMLQFARRLSFHGLTPTLATTRFILRTNAPTTGSVAVAAISDGFDEDGVAAAPSFAAYVSRLESVGSGTLSGLIASLRADGNPVDVLVYDAFLPWALDVAKGLSVPAATFFTQSCAVNAVYLHVVKGRLAHPVAAAVALPGLPPLDAGDLPWFLTEPPPGVYPALLEFVLNQVRNIDGAALVLINSFYELERQELEWLESVLPQPVKTIGPMVPSAYLDNRLPDNSHYGFHLFAPDTGTCMPWLDSKPLRSTVYISFGTMGTLTKTQTAELAQGLKASGKNFLWVVKASEASKLPEGYSPEQGVVVAWSPQLEVLAHPAVGCFVTHCGWNSTTEALSLGVPMVGMQMSADQTTNAKYVEDVWRVGVRVRVDEEGVVRAGEVERCIREVMEGERSEEIRENTRRWREATRMAVDEGGSSDKNIVEFISKYCM